MGGISESGYLPKEILGITNLFNTTTNSIMPIYLGDSYDLRVQLKVDSVSGNPSRMDLQLDIGVGATPSIVISSQSAAIKVGVPAYIIYSFPIFSLSTFISNGGKIFLNTNTGSLTVTDRTIFIIRTSSVGS